MRRGNSIQGQRQQRGRGRLPVLGNLNDQRQLRRRRVNSGQESIP